MSRGGKNGRGIAYDWFRKYCTDIFPHDEVPIPGRGVFKKVPRYYEANSRSMPCLQTFPYSPHIKKRTFCGAKASLSRFINKTKSLRSKLQSSEMQKMKRRSMSRSKSKRLFSSTASGTHRKNVQARPQRGGIRM